MKIKFRNPGLICGWLLAAWLYLPHPALADAPKELALGYDLPTQMLAVAITHPSSFTDWHYVKQVQIKKNNEPAAKNDYTSQTGKTAFAYTYKIPATVNDRFEVITICNIRGTKTATLTVGEPQK